MCMTDTERKALSRILGDLQNSCSLHDFAELVDSHAETFISSHELLESLDLLLMRDEIPDDNLYPNKETK